MNIYSQVSDEYVKPLFFEYGQEVEVRLLVKENVSDVSVHYMHDGVLVRNNEFVLDGNYYCFKIKSLPEGEFLRYYFSFNINGKYYFYSKKGISRYFPSDKDSFTLKCNLSFPHWIANSTSYQIFPDRFNNGDPSCNVAAGEYEYDGALVQAKSFSDIPQDFEHARCLDFFNGDLKGVEDKIEHFKNLGITLLYINPIFDSKTTHRFDTIDYFKIDKKLGGDEALISLVKKAHENGIKIILDISINHTGSGAAWFKKALEDKNCKEAKYYYFDKDGNYKAWAGVPTLPQLNYNCKELREIIYENSDSVLLRYLQEPFNIDGWRLDVAPELGRNDSDLLTYEVWQGVRKAVKGLNKDFYLVGEDWIDSSAYLNGDMWDATMNYYGSGRIIRSFLGEKDRFLSAAWGHNPEVSNEFDAFDTCDALTYSLDATLCQARFFHMNLFDSHDTPRLHNNTAIYNKDTYMACLALLYLMPGMPNIYYGDEVSLDGDIKNVESSRYPMQWDENLWDKEIYEFHKLVGKIRKENKFLSFASTHYIAIDEFTFVQIRKTENEAILLFVNKDNKDKEFVFETPLINFNKIECLYNTAASVKDGKLIINLKANKSVMIKTI